MKYHLNNHPLNWLFEIFLLVKKGVIVTSILRLLFIFIFILITKSKAIAQEKPLFTRVFEGEETGVRFYEILCTKEGSVRLSSSIGIWKLKGHEMNVPGIPYTGEIIDNITGKKNYLKKFTNPEAEDSIRAMVEGPDSIFSMLLKITISIIHQTEIYKE